MTGMMTETNSEIIVEDGHRYVFEKENFVSQEDFELLWLNVFARDGKDKQRYEFSDDGKRVRAVQGWI